MQTEIVPYGGWNRNLRLFNPACEVITSLEVGPRILCFRLHGRDNILKNYQEQLGQSHEEAWMIRGGHRLWSAPEDEKISYHRDNEAVEHYDQDGFVTLVSRQREPIQIAKEISLRLDSEQAVLTIRHRIRNEGQGPLKLATWGLTVMEPAGVAIIPQPPLGKHPEDLLPNRVMVLWPYTDLSDARLHLGQRFLLLRQAADFPPIKLGLSLKLGWAAYLWGDLLFVKSFAWESGREYPDGGCNFETFANHEMIEIESLGPLTHLEPGQETGHEETWRLFHVTEALELSSEEALVNWLRPYLSGTGLSL